jgi:hypothetical protein
MNTVLSTAKPKGEIMFFNVGKERLYRFGLQVTCDWSVGAMEQWSL